MMGWMDSMAYSWDGTTITRVGMAKTVGANAGAFARISLCRASRFLTIFLQKRMRSSIGGSSEQCLLADDFQSL